MLTNKIELSIVVDFQCENTLLKTLKSIFQGNAANDLPVEVIVLDSQCTEQSHLEYEEAKKIGGGKVSCIEVKQLTVGLYQEIMAGVRGAYAALIESGAVYSSGCIQAVLDKVKDRKTDAVSVNPVFCNPNGEIANYPITPSESGQYCVIECPETMQFLLKAFFIRKELFNEIKFRQEGGMEYRKLFLMDMFAAGVSYYYFAEHTLMYYMGEENDASTNLYQYRKEWYTESVEQVLTPYMRQAFEGDYNKRRFMACCMMYLIYMKFRCNENDRNKNVLNRDEYLEFLRACQELLKYTDENIIMLKHKIGRYSVSRVMKMFMLQLRNDYLNLDNAVADEEGSFVLKVHEAGEQPEQNNVFRKLCIIGGNNTETIQILAINYRKPVLEIDAVVSPAEVLNREQICVFAEIDDERVEAVPTSAYALTKYFGVTCTKGYTVHLTIPVNFRRNKQRLNFFFVYNDQKMKLKIRFPKPASRLSGKLPDHGYWKFSKDRILYKFKGSLYILKQDRLHRIVREIKLWQEVLEQNKEDKKQAHEIIRLRLAYHLYKILYKNRRIWLTGDKIYKAGDNGEYMYHYIHDHVKDVKIYYVISKDSLDYERLKKSGADLLIHESFKCRLMALLAEAILATHTTIMSYYGIPQKQQPYLKDLFNAEIICIQHGLTIQKIAQYQGRLADNTNFYCCASKYEVNNILHPVYDYKKENVALVGMARYDGLKDHDQKKILITPTWRKELTNLGIGYIQKSYNQHFKNSEYFKIYNALIHDEMLIQTAKRCGYAIVYLLHPSMSAQSRDFDQNGYVQIMEATGDMNYEKILTESSLMVTDYSGVQFDFAYMRKPVVYYHPDALPPHYEEGGLKYETMGFGPVCRTHEEIVNTICKAMENQCKNEPLYAERANDFFEFDDYDNCRRIYEAAENYMQHVKKHK